MSPGMPPHLVVVLPPRPLLVAAVLFAAAAAVAAAVEAGAQGEAAAASTPGLTRPISDRWRTGGNPPTIPRPENTPPHRRRRPAPRSLREYHTLLVSSSPRSPLPPPHNRQRLHRSRLFSSAPAVDLPLANDLRYHPGGSRSSPPWARRPTSTEPGARPAACLSDCEGFRGCRLVESPRKSPSPPPPFRHRLRAVRWRYHRRNCPCCRVIVLLPHP